ncbi:MAG: VapC toxin family PIN domain ribonuclease [Brachymonas sp.]|nr:VapC toxin family PIN domain ribonuclease [Brachymonas sp.]
MQSLTSQRDVVISELVLLELYVLLRNATVNPQPLNASEASRVCDAFRQNPHWQVVGLPPEARPFHDKLWKALAQADMPRRRAFDIRLSLSLQDAGVHEFATVNLKDFVETGFKRVWNPLAEHQESN